MFRPAFRAVPLVKHVSRAQPGQRFVSTTSSKSRSWKGSAIRWAAAGAIVYYYNTSAAFAEEPQYALHAPLEAPHESETYQSVHAIAEQRRSQARASLQQSSTRDQTGSTEGSASEGEMVAAGDPGELEEEAAQQGAFNEETGEINWDCPCLGGMAYGPCGEQFRAAFSCFVFSKDEPKGVDCIEHFKTMQNCFREHPEVYGSELDEEEVDAQLDAQDRPGNAAALSEAQDAPRSELPVSSEGANGNEKHKIEQHAQ